MTSIIYNAEHVLQSAIAAAFSVGDVNPTPYKGTIEDAKAVIKADEGMTYVFDESITYDDVNTEKIIGAVPIAQLSRHSVPRSIITFLNKYHTSLMVIYLGMLETEEYASLQPFPAFFRLFSSVDFDIRMAGKFIRRAMIRDRHANSLAADIPTFMHRGALFVRYGPYVDRRVAMEKEKEDAPESIVVFSDNTGFSNGADVTMRLIVYGKIPGCLSEATFNETVDDGKASVGSLPMVSWAVLMKGAKVE